MRKPYLRLLFKVLRKRGILSDTVLETKILLVLSNEHLPNLESNLKIKPNFRKSFMGRWLIETLQLKKFLGNIRFCERCFTEYIRRVLMRQSCRGMPFNVITETEKSSKKHQASTIFVIRLFCIKTFSSGEFNLKVQLERAEPYR